MAQSRYDGIIKKHFSTKIFLIGIIFSAITLVLEKCSCRFVNLIFQLDFGIPTWFSTIIESISFISFSVLFIGLFIFRRHCLGKSEKNGLILVAITSIVNVAISIWKSMLLLCSGINYASIVSLIPLAIQIAITISIISGIVDFKWGKNPQHTADALIFAISCKFIFAFVLCVISYILKQMMGFVLLFQILMGPLAVTKPIEETSRTIALHLANVVIAPSTIVSAVMYLSVLFRIKNDIKKLDKIEYDTTQ